jgi:hypothetical protein
MRKMNFLRTVLSVATAMLVTVTAFGQVPETDYSVFNTDVTNGATHVDSTDYVTRKAGGTTMGYFAVPDPVYHPNYNAGGGWQITNGFIWNWVSAPATVTFTPAAPVTDTNYVEITYPDAVATYSISVAEQAPAAFGGCVDATPTYLRVSVINPPTGTASINPGVLWQVITPNVSYQICGAQAAQTVTVAFNESVPNHLASYAFQITETIEVLSGTGAVLATPQAEVAVQDFPLASKLKAGNLGALPSAAFNRATPAFTYTFLSDVLALQNYSGNPARTRYTYRVTRTGDAAQNGFVSNISQKSDYISGTVNYYNFTNQTVSFILNPTPVTGPIYYVPNNFNY